MANLPQKQVQCPYCKAVLIIKNLTDEREKTFNCPKCHQTSKVSFVPKPGTPPQEIPEAKTQYVMPQPQKPSRPAADEGKTQYVGATTPQGITPGGGKMPPPPPLTARIVVNGRVYPLKQQNTIGRRANSGNASVQIDTTDMYMSRNHVSIDIYPLPDGSIKPVLKITAAKNQTIVRGKLMNPGDILILQNGDRITMGVTEVTFML